MGENVLVSTQDRITRIQIDRPAKKNALTQAMYTALADAIAVAEADSSVRVLLLTGSETVFTAGNDIGDFLSGFSVSEGSPVVRFLFALAEAQKPVVAAVNGPAIGIGTTLLLHCDLVYCGRGARFQLPFVNLGLVPEAGSSYLLSAALGHRHAAALLMLGDAFDAEAARSAGIVNAVVADGEVLEAATQAAHALAAKPPDALRLTKALLKRWSKATLTEALRVEAEIVAQRLQSPETVEAMQAFLERRAPDFSRFV